MLQPVLAATAVLLAVAGVCIAAARRSPRPPVLSSGGLGRLETGALNETVPTSDAETSSPDFPDQPT